MKGFTLVELVVVVMIVMILAAVAVTSSNGILKTLSFGNTFNKAIFMVQQARSLAVPGGDVTIKGYGVRFSLNSSNAATLFSTTENITDTDAVSLGKHTTIENYQLASNSGLAFGATPNNTSTSCTSATITFIHGSTTAKLTCEGASPPTSDILTITLKTTSGTSKSFSIHRASGIPQQ